MTTATMPASRFGWQGQTVEYTVKTSGTARIVTPVQSPHGLRVRVLATRQVDGGTEARVAVNVAGPVFY